PRVPRAGRLQAASHQWRLMSPIFCVYDRLSTSAITAILPDDRGAPEFAQHNGSGGGFGGSVVGPMLPAEIPSTSCRLVGQPYIYGSVKPHDSTTGKLTFT